MGQVPKHVAIIMDGNGRWAEKRRRPRYVGHVAGARKTHEIIRAASGMGIEVLSIYAFSGDNWKRPKIEVDALMRIFCKYLTREVKTMVEWGVQVEVIGRRDRIPARLVAIIEEAEERTGGGNKLNLRLAIDYSARESLMRANSECGSLPSNISNIISAATFEEALRQAIHLKGAYQAVDLMIRTGGEQRLSDFLLYESAYAELFFSPKLWPDFSESNLQEALDFYALRDRRFGGV